jgi:hypothetical protein
MHRLPNDLQRTAGSALGLHVWFSGPAPLRADVDC